MHSPKKAGRQKMKTEPKKHRVVIKPELYREFKKIEAETDVEVFDQINTILTEHLAARRMKGRK